MYAVVVYNNFDDETPVYTFNDEEKAQKYLRKLYEEALEQEIRENSKLDMENTYYDEDNDFAQIKWYDGCFIQYTLTFTTQMDKRKETL